MDEPRTADRFWSKVAKGDGCWIWQGSRNDDGYGRFYREPSGSRYERAHRVAWTYTNGPIPPGMAVCHSCDNPPCVNPAHLFLGSIADNNRDMQSKGRGRIPDRDVLSRAGAKAKGEANGMHTLTPEIVRAVRAAKGSQRAIALAYGLSQVHVGRIRRREAWSWLT